MLGRGGSSPFRRAVVRCAGSRHLRAGTPTEDQARALDDLPGWTFLVVADGCGSARCARAGAELACDLLLQHLAAHLPEEGSPAEGWMAGAYRAARADLLASVAATGLAPAEPASDYASTLLVAALGPTEAWLGQLGDGALCVRVAGEWSPAFPPDHGESLELTHFLTDRDALERLQLRRIEGVEAVALFSDGLERVLLHWPGPSAFAPALDALAHGLADAGDVATFERQLLGWIERPELNRVTDDDRSLALAVRSDP